MASVCDGDFILFFGGSGKCSVEGHFPYICGLLWPAVFAGIPARRGLLGID